MTGRSPRAGSGDGSMMHQASLPAPGPRTRRRLRRERQRRATMRALWAGLILQATLTVAVLLALHWIRAPLHRFSLNPLFAISLAAMLLPSWIGGLAAGYLAPRPRWWQLAAFGLLAALLFLADAVWGWVVTTGWMPFVRSWLAANLVLDFLIGGAIGHWLRRRERNGS